MYILKIVLLILIILIILIYVIKKNSFYESFEIINEKGLLCGTEYDVCRINQLGKSSCCDGYSCIRPNGDFEDKVCIGTTGTVGTSRNIGTKDTWLSKIFNINDFVSLPTSYELCEEEELVTKLKDMCGNPYKLNFNIPKCPNLTYSSSNDLSNDSSNTNWCNFI